MRGLTPLQVLAGKTKSPWTTNFTHLLPVRPIVHRLIAQKRVDALSEIVHHRHRIKYWNIVPGDQVRLRKDSSDKIYKVDSIDRLKNRVYVEDPVSSPSKSVCSHTNVFWLQEHPAGPEAKEEDFIQCHYSRCQLFLGRFLMPNANQTDKPEEIP
jgi:hypothetical protein